jgi:hypothetical protein
MKKINIYAAFFKLSKRVSIRTLLSLGLLASFFLPWIKTGDDYTIFGYDILLKAFNSERAGISLIFADLIIAISVYNIIRDLLQIKKTIFLFLNEFILGLILSILFVFFVVYIHGGVVGFGIYSMAIFSVWGIIKTCTSFQCTGKQTGFDL